MIDTAITYSLGWTLIHSFWQLTVLAVLFYALMTGLKNQKPQIRYRLSLLFMMFSVSVTSLTFIFMYRNFIEISPIQTFMGSTPMMVDIAPGVIQSSGLWQDMVNFFQRNISSVTYMYMIGVVLLLIRMGINYWSLSQLKYQSEVIGRDKIAFFQDLFKKMNVRRNIDVRTSDNVLIPMVIGSLRPIILIPASILANTTPNILEAILAHELAHIERHDFTINLIQTVIETLFFYHPAVWYFSYIARREREFCCDQRAVDAGCRREDLARALSQVGELQRPHELSMSLVGPTNDLLNRVKYLLGFKTTYHYVPNHSIWYYGSLIGVFLLFSLGKSQFFQSANNEDGSSPPIAAVDTLPKNQNIEIEKNVWVQSDEENSNDTIIDYRYDENTINQTEYFHEIQINVDTTVQVIRTDTIPGQKKLVVIQADGKVIVIANGDTVSVHQNPDMRKWQDSMTVMQRRMRAELQNQKLDSLMAQHRQNIGEQRRYMRIQKKYLDSMNRNLPEIKSRIQSFQNLLPDSIHRFSFGIPHIPEMNMDSLMIRKDFLPIFKEDFSLDSMFFPKGNVSMHHFTDSLWNIGSDVSLNMFSDSLFSSFSAPYTGVYGLSQIGPKSKEMKELDKKIRDKERELMELRREQQKNYREEYLKKKEGSERK